MMVFAFINFAFAKVWLLPDYQRNQFFSYRINNEDKTNIPPDDEVKFSCGNYSGMISLSALSEDMTCIEYFNGPEKCCKNWICNSSKYPYNDDLCAFEGKIGDKDSPTCLNKDGTSNYQKCICDTNKYPYTLSNCNKILSGLTCTDDLGKHYEKCVTDPCTEAQNNNLCKTCDYGCTTKHSDCNSCCIECSSCTPTKDCSSYALSSCPDNASCSYCNNGCDEAILWKIDSCDEGYTNKNTYCECNQQDCSAYTLTSKSDANAEYEDCIVGCGDSTPKYKFLKCKNGYELEGGVCVVTCEPNDCSTYTLTSKSDANAEYEQCIAGCGNNTPKYKFKKCKNGYELEGGVCVGTCEPNDCSGYNLNDCPTHAICDDCDLGCGSGYKYKITSCDNGFYKSGNTCECDPDYCDGYPLTSAPTINVASYDSCVPTCGGGVKYKVTKCNDGTFWNGSSCVTINGAIIFTINGSKDNTSLTMHLGDDSLYANIDWGDGNVETITTEGYNEHIYRYAGDYTVTITGNVPEFYVSIDKNNGWVAAHVTSILQLDLESVTDMTVAFSDQGNLVGAIPSFPPNLKYAGSAFAWCDGITSVPESLPESLIEAEAMFYNCSSLTALPRLPASLEISGRDGGSSSSSHYYYFRNGMFEGCSSAKGDIPQISHTKIKYGNRMFKGCSSLTGTISELPTTLTQADSMFEGCSGLTGSIPNIPSKVTKAHSMFRSCSGLTGAITSLPSGITDGRWMFEGCSGLTGAIPDFPTGLTMMNSMFKGCSNLTGPIPEFPSGLTSISNAFENCSNLEGSIPDIPSGVERGDEAFKNCSKLTGSTPRLPDNMTTATFMFSGCKNLNGTITNLPTALTDGTYMFNDCSGLTGSIPTLPSTLRESTYMFNNCSGLTGSIPTLPSTLTYCLNMFNNCSGLTGSIPTLPSNLSVAQNMFSGCSNLTGAIPTLPSGLNNATHMFKGAISLSGTAPTIPSSLDSSTCASSSTGKCYKTFQNTSVTNDGSWPTGAW